MRFKLSALVALASTVQFTIAIKIDVSNQSPSIRRLDEQSADTDPASLESAAAAAAKGMMSFYPSSGEVGIFGDPYYWWEAGAVWGALIDYWAYTKDDTYVSTVQEAIAAQVGPEKDFIVPNHRDQEGNDDQAFWICAALSGLELNHTAPPGMTWLSLSEAGFESMASRWDTTTCDGGLTWQIYSDNVNGLNYKNSISNLGLFQVAARLARFTGEDKYVQWAVKVWDWMEGVGLISEDYRIFDGTDKVSGCQKPSGNAAIEWSYNNAMAMYGCAVMYSLTGEAVWKQRVERLLSTGQERFFGPFPNATGVLYEAACESAGTCNVDMKSFKGYLSRWWAKSAMLVPDIADNVTSLLETSAAAAAQSCSGEKDGAMCGNRWYVEGWDGSTGVGEQLSSLETFQALLTGRGGLPLVKKGVKLKGPGDPTQAGKEKSTSTSTNTTPKATSTTKAQASSTGSLSMSPTSAGSTSTPAATVRAISCALLASSIASSTLWTMLTAATSTSTKALPSSPPSSLQTLPGSRKPSTTSFATSAGTLARSRSKRANEDFLAT